jgi:hypothetical protein
MNLDSIFAPSNPKIRPIFCVIAGREMSMPALTKNAGDRRENVTDRVFDSISL